jgi:hypothetical protein
MQIPDFCPHFQAILVASTDKEVLVVRTRCKMWTCPYCAIHNQKMWRARIIEHINNPRPKWIFLRVGFGAITETASKKWTWFTLTAHSKKRGAASLANLRRAWDTLIKRAKRKYGKFDYVRVYERHKDGSYHLHAIASFHFGDIKERKARVDGSRTKYSVWLKKNATELKLGYYTHADDIQRNHAGYIASYVTKYMTKLSDTAMSEFGRIRRIQASQGWAKWRKEKKYDWSIESGIFEQDLNGIFRQEKRIIDIQTGENVTYDNFIDHIIYPPEFDAGFKDWQARNKT